MTEREFIAMLPTATECEQCASRLDNISWQVGRYGRQWFGLGIAKCEACSLVRVAAAGSDDLSHSFAGVQRRRFLQAMGTNFH